MTKEQKEFIDNFRIGDKKKVLVRNNTNSIWYERYFISFNDKNIYVIKEENIKRFKKKLILDIVNYQNWKPIQKKKIRKMTKNEIIDLIDDEKCNWVKKSNDFIDKIISIGFEDSSGYDFKLSDEGWEFIDKIVNYYSYSNEIKGEYKKFEVEI